MHAPPQCLLPSADASQAQMLQQVQDMETYDDNGAGSVNPAQAVAGAPTIDKLSSPANGEDLYAQAVRCGAVATRGLGRRHRSEK